MKKELEQELFKKYPQIFKQKDLPMTQTCMCWGIECGDGWYKLIDTLCSMLQFDIDNNKRPQLEAVQVKEKYGTLRFYVSNSDDKQDGMIEFAEYLSSITCEKCGSMDKVTQTRGSWITTLCEKCMKDKNENT